MGWGEPHRPLPDREGIDALIDERDDLQAALTAESAELAAVVDVLRRIHADWRAQHRTLTGVVMPWATNNDDADLLERCGIDDTVVEVEG